MTSCELCGVQVAAGSKLGSELPRVRPCHCQAEDVRLCERCDREIASGERDEVRLRCCHEAHASEPE